MSLPANRIPPPGSSPRPCFAGTCAARECVASPTATRRQMAFGVAGHVGSRSGRLTSSNEGTWVLSHHASNAAPQTSQAAPPVCGSRNFVSVRLYSAPQWHRTIVAIFGICARNRLFSSPEVRRNQTDPTGVRRNKPPRCGTGPRPKSEGGLHEAYPSDPPCRREVLSDKLRAASLLPPPLLARQSHMAHWRQRRLSSYPPLEGEGRRRRTKSEAVGVG
jgi:hypothetical protein